MTIKLVLSAFTAVFLLSACQTTPAVELTTEQTETLKTTWLGKKWEGSWGGSCTGSVEVLEVSGNRAKVNYKWGHCGNAAPGSTIDDNATLSEQEMKLTLWRGTTADYTLQSDGSLIGIYYNPRNQGSGRGTFTLVH